MLRDSGRVSSKAARIRRPPKISMNTIKSNTVTAAAAKLSTPPTAAKMGETAPSNFAGSPCSSFSM